MRLNNVLKLIIAIAACQFAGLIGSIFTTPSITTWYAGIQKPGFTPPGWIFAPVWITLFFLMGVSAYLVWKKGLENKYVFSALVVFDIQLLLNILWSYLFFSLHSPLYAFVEILILWFVILITIIIFYRISKIAAYLLLPYIAWVSFAAFLNFSIWQLNL